ncbi:E3 ubiquitin-protein ligase synoviolin B-like isoform X2 [Gigantopelta aegis]|uniref:E3 ubiquitin-protein ligase synoviolin B-like isoform X2 n=1 Tax=Gigantopelta aegis TaxID=1735272 RepID=UPI001B88BE0C|nr:E3 ubiquitin-protein ligase synoviolin B-like isoform X2 [Gigantopelta aegis]
MRSFLLTTASFLLTGFVVGNAYFQKKQFYPSVVYITKSNPSMAVLYFQAFVFVTLMGKLMRKIFFGQLRAAEMEHLIERSWYAVTETCLAFTVFRDDFSPRFVALFTLLLFIKCFHWLAEDRVDYMERSPVISFVFHCRVWSLLMVLGSLDIFFVNHAYYSTLLKGASVQLVFGFEYAILFTVVLMTFVKYVLHSRELQSENPWEQKAVYLLYTELIIGMVRVILYVAFMTIMIKVHTFPLFAIRPMYLSMRSFKKALHDVIMSRRAIRNMNTLYPDATAEELAEGDNVCIICREEMATNCKKLPCNHIFHASCLRSWFQRQQTCPTCRMDVLRMPRPEPVPIIQDNQAEQQRQYAQAFFQQAFPQMWPPPPFVPGQPPHPHQLGQQQLGQQQPAPAQTPTPPSTQSPSGPNQPSPSTQSGATGGAAASPASTLPTAFPASTPGMPGVPPFDPMFNMMSYMSPFGFPQPPQTLSGLSDEELKNLEGQERENIEARIQWLRDIQSLLDGAMVLINQYNQVAAQSSIPGIAASSLRSSTTPGTPGTIPNKMESTQSTPNTTSAKLGGAKPKITPVKKENSSPATELKMKNGKIEQNIEGAVGFTAPTEDSIPEWEDPREEQHEDELHEVRKRRLQKFTSESIDRTQAKSDLD